MRQLQTASCLALQRLLVALVAVAAFVNTAGNCYAFDDLVIVQANPLVHDLSRWKELFRHDYWYPFWVGGLYRPLDLLSFAWQWRWSPDQPIWYHLGNVLLHALATVLVFELGRRLLSLRAAWMAALWFALLPTHVGVVAGLVGRAELGSALFALAALLLAVSHRDARPARQPVITVRAIAAGLCTLVALLFKETAITTAGLALLLIWAESPAENRRARLRSWLAQPGLATIVAASLIYLAIRVAVVGLLVKSVSWVENPLAFTSTATRLRTALWIGCQNLVAMLWPYGLAPDYSYRQIPLLTDWGAPLFWVSAAGVIVIAAALFIPLRREPALRRLLEGRHESVPLFFGLAFAGLAWLPVSNLPFAIGTIRANRLLYLPSVGFAVGLAWLWDQLWERLRQNGWKVVWGLATALLLASFFSTDQHENRIWQDDATLFPVAVRRAPNSAKAHYLMAYLQMRDRRYAQAAAEYRKALQIDPTFANAAEHLAEALDHSGQATEALGWYRRSLQLHPTAASLQASLTAELRAGHAEEVLRLAQQYQGQVQPASEVVIGLALLQQHETAAAVAILGAAARDLPLQPEAHRAYACALVASGATLEADDQWQQARRLTPPQPVLDQVMLPGVEAAVPPLPGASPHAPAGRSPDPTRRRLTGAGQWKRRSWFERRPIRH